MTSNIYFRIIFIGDSRAGKSSIIRRYCANDFSEKYTATTNLEFNSSIKICTYIKDEIEYSIPIRLHIWDTGNGGVTNDHTGGTFDSTNDNIGGCLDYKNYLMNMDCIVVVLDVNEPQSLDNVKTWYNNFTHLNDVANHKPIIFMVGNKIDARNENVIIKFDLDFPYIEVSAKNNYMISDLFNRISYALLKTHPEIIDFYHTKYKNNTDCCIIS
jgi:GTPase SAR1 family protein